VLAVIESNESLTTYDVKAKISGTVIGREASLGEVVSENDNIYVVANLESVWATFNVNRQDFSKIKADQKIILDGETPETSNIEATISYVSPVTVEETQTLIARSEIPNAEGHLRPGMYLTGNVVLEEKEVPVAVKASAIQTFRDWQVVFQQVGDLFEIVIVELGIRDGDLVEIVSGLKPGTKYVTENSFVIKADILKSGASHDH
jgi:cobalt-zinc-cadmium efflux system membrane fusion protein